jgi:hypothetical protein
MTMEQLIPISNAARIIGTSESYLLQLTLSGKIKGMLSPTGEILVKEADAISQLPRDERPEYIKHSHLKGVSIGVREAERKYGIPNPTISRWVKKGYIRILEIGGHGRPTMIDEADIAFCAEIYRSDPGQGKRIFNENGTPYTKKS